jgi:flagellar L-ring protein precursor FlgH
MNKPFSSLCRLRRLCAGLLLLSPAFLHGQSLWKAGSCRSMVADKRASAVGDILTIVIQENNSASKANNTQTTKKTGINDSISSFLYPPGASGLLTKGGQLPALAMTAQHDFSGGGQINNSEQITSQIAVRVVDVLPNGNLLIEGHKQTAFAGESQDAVLQGIVRREDISANNTIFSYNVADARIKFMSKGAVSDTQKKGWFTSLFEKVSPF